MLPTSHPGTNPWAARTASSSVLRFLKAHSDCTQRLQACLLDRVWWVLYIIFQEGFPVSRNRRRRRRGGNGHISPWGPDNATLAKIATVKSCASGQCFKTEKYVGERYSDFTAGCDTTGRCKGVADGAQTVENGASVFESSTEVFCCSGDTCNGANARAVWHPLILLFALLLGSAAILP